MTYPPEIELYDHDYTELCSLRLFSTQSMLEHSLWNNTRNPKHVPSNICAVSVTFWYDGDKSDRQAWADKYRGAILKRLAGKGFGWWLSMHGMSTETKDSGVKIHHDLIEVLAKKAATLWDPSLPPWQYWQSAISNYRRWEFVYFPSDEIPRIVERHWGDAYPAWNLHGCCVREDERLRAFDWLQREPIELLELMERCEYLMLCWPSENVNFTFLSTKHDGKAIRNLIAIEEIQQDALSLWEANNNTSAIS